MKVGAGVRRPDVEVSSPKNLWTEILVLWENIRSDNGRMVVLKGGEGKDTYE